MQAKPRIHLSQVYKKSYVPNKKKTPALLHGVFRRGENAPSRQMFCFTYLTLTENLP